jgi:hypothetical protein
VVPQELWPGDDVGPWGELFSSDYLERLNAPTDCSDGPSEPEPDLAYLGTHRPAGIFCWCWFCEYFVWVGRAATAYSCSMEAVERL